MTESEPYTQLIKEVREKSQSFNPSPLIKRDFISLSDGQNENMRKDNIFRIMQWNLLAQGLCQSSDGFILCPSAALNWCYRQYHILEELLSYSVDIFFLEEVDQFNYIKTCLEKINFDGLFLPKPDSPCLYEAENFGSDGCAIFWKKDKFELISHDECILLNDAKKKTNQVSLICKFRDLASGKVFMCAATHLKSKPGYENYRFQQGKYLESILREKAAGLPLILCGDFNAEPSELVVQVMKSSELGFRSAYSNLSEDGQEPPYTTWKVRSGKSGKNEEACHTIDYIFYTEKNIKCVKLLKLPTAEQIGPGRLPSYSYPSDHLSLAADFILL
ncbi:nocturnin-like [Biomphalaria glabrata]|uniref:Nocturnin n=1 Tax=Biomphalaria glabrata TaxID=6526 RepID=A0A9W3B6U3_BIOGL|nr:nocturnin-like [Biomphalaria glabrata]XP_055895190.1 nocturnin-like [Biomphalaria glabrata]XP_055895191.1 nocturnin-like [Biomphalaria glabrata]KAI8797927.1 nocturnin [Biomphalaria glabrata]